MNTIEPVNSKHINTYCENRYIIKQGNCIVFPRGLTSTHIPYTMYRLYRMFFCNCTIRKILLQCILSIFPARVHQFYANILVFVNINPFLYINDQFALFVSVYTSNINPININLNFLDGWPVYEVKCLYSRGQE